MAESGVEILCVGTELLLGDILNGNARWLAQRLAALGLPHYRQTVVGDNLQRLAAAVREAAMRSRVLITTGGLGPTPDDLTTEALAAAFETPLRERPELWDEIQAKLVQRWSSSGPLQPSAGVSSGGGGGVAQPAGVCPSMIWSPQPGFTVPTFPGVPSEMRGHVHADG